MWTPTRFPARASSTLTSDVNHIGLHSSGLLLVDMPRTAGEPDGPHAAPMAVDPPRRDVLLARAPWIACALRVLLPHGYLRFPCLLRFDGGKKSRTSTSNGFASFSSIATVGLIRPFSTRTMVTKETPARRANSLTE